MYYINRLCDRVIWLKNGLIAMEGSAHEVTQAYETYQLKKEAAKTARTPASGEGTAPAASSSIVIHDVILTPFPNVRSGDDLTLGMEIMSMDDSVPYRVAAVLLRIDELRIIGVSTKDHDPLYGSRNISLCFPSLQLKEGTFFLKIHVMDENFVHKYDTRATTPFTVPKESIEPGFINIPYRWKV